MRLNILWILLVEIPWKSTGIYHTIFEIEIWVLLSLIQGQPKMTWTKHKVIVWFVATRVSVLNVDIVQLKKTPFNIVIDIIIGCTYFDLAWFLLTPTSSKHTHNTSPNGINICINPTLILVYFTSQPLWRHLVGMSKQTMLSLATVSAAFLPSAVNLYNPLKTKNHGSHVLSWRFGSNIFSCSKRVTFWFNMFFFFRRSMS